MIVAGFGFRQGADLESLEQAFAATGAKSVDAIATVESKATAQAFVDLAERLGVPLVAVRLDELLTQSVLTQSQASQSAYGTGSVSEAAALAAIGAGAQLLGRRVVSKNGKATCAIAAQMTNEGELR